MANVRADVYTYSVSTDSPAGWWVAKLNVDGYERPSQVANGENSGFYTNVGTEWKDVAYNDATWSGLNWTRAVAGTRTTWTENGVNASDWVALPGGTGSNVNKVASGFYAFSYSLSAVEAEVAAVSGSLSLNLRADDYIAAIYANGKELFYSTTVALGERVGDDINGQGSWLNGWDVNFNDVGLINGVLDLVFVVHNTNAGYLSDKDNPMGLYVKGTLTTDIKFNPIIIPPPTPSTPIEPTTSPEPATLAVFGLGLAGLGLVRRRMKK